MGICKICKKKYKRTNGRQKVCIKCRNQNCEGCGKEIKPPYKFYRKKRFCGKCAIKWNRERMRRQSTLNPTKTKISKKELLNLWERYKKGMGRISLQRLFKQKGYKSRSLKLREIVGAKEYDKVVGKYDKMSHGKRYKKGRALEYRAMRQLEKEGYWCRRTAASKGAFDVVAFNENEVRMIQVKSNRPFYGKEKQHFIDLNVPSCVKKELWVYHDFKREPHITEYL